MIERETEQKRKRGNETLENKNISYSPDKKTYSAVQTEDKK